MLSYHRIDLFYDTQGREEYCTQVFLETGGLRDKTDWNTWSS